MVLKLANQEGAVSVPRCRVGPAWVRGPRVCGGGPMGCVRGAATGEAAAGAQDPSSPALAQAEC